MKYDWSDKAFDKLLDFAETIFSVLEYWSVGFAMVFVPIMLILSVIEKPIMLPIYALMAGSIALILIKFKKKLALMAQDERNVTESGG